MLIFCFVFQQVVFRDEGELSSVSTYGCIQPVQEPVQFVEDAMLVPPLSLSWSKCPFQTLYLLNECIGPKFNN